MARFLSVALLAGFGLIHAGAPAGPPTETEIKVSLERTFAETYVDPRVWKITRIRCQFGPVKLGRQSWKQIQWGKPAEAVWPVKAEVRVERYRGNQLYDSLTRGDKPDDVFFFYKDPFDQWRFKAGSL